MPKAKFFRVAVEGATIDGRTIAREWLEEMAASYNPATYTARINCSHVTGYSPDKPFNAYGSVLSLRTQEIDLAIDGRTEKRLALYAEIDANDQLVAVNRAGQKLFTSCEIHPDFAGTGKAYLVGLAITDTPASLGTEPLKFAALSRANAFSPAEEIETLEFEATPADAATIGNSIGAAIVAFFKREGGKPEGSAANDQGAAQAAAPAAPATPAPAAANDNFDAQAFAGIFASAIADAIKPANDGVAQLAGKFEALETRLAATENPGAVRHAATGGGASIVTDC